MDVIFLQEVAQYKDEEIVIANIKPSNYAYQIQQLLKEQGYTYFLYYEPIKFSFNKYDEGVAILSKSPLQNVTSHFISKQKDYQSWKTRKIISGELNLNNTNYQFISAHLGWNDEIERYDDQFTEMMKLINQNSVVIIGGDFNISPRTKEYASILKSGLIDLYGLNPKYLFVPTHKPNIDIHEGGTRIDYIFSNHHLEVYDRDILFKENTVSDHFGVFLEIK